MRKHYENFVLAIKLFKSIETRFLGGVCQRGSGNDYCHSNHNLAIRKRDVNIFGSHDAPGL